MGVMVTASELCRQAGTSMRQIQTWTNAGALRPEEGGKHPGRGGTRLYAAEEVDVAKVLGAISHHGMSVKEAKSVAETVRKVVLAPQRYQFRGLSEAIEVRSVFRARLPQHNVRVQLYAPKILKRYGEKWKHVASQTEDMHLVEAWIAIELAKRRENRPQLCLYRLNDGQWLVNTVTVGRPALRPIPSNWRAGYVLNLEEIFRN